MGELIGAMCADITSFILLKHRQGPREQNFTREVCRRGKNQRRNHTLTSRWIGWLTLSGLPLLAFPPPPPKHFIHGIPRVFSRLSVVSCVRDSDSSPPPPPPPSLFSLPLLSSLSPGSFSSSFRKSLKASSAFHWYPQRLSFAASRGSFENLGSTRGAFQTNPRIQSKSNPETLKIPSAGILRLCFSPP